MTIRKHLFGKRTNQQWTTRN